MIRPAAGGNSGCWERAHMYTPHFAREKGGLPGPAPRGMIVSYTYRNPPCSTPGSGKNMVSGSEKYTLR